MAETGRTRIRVIATLFLLGVLCSGAWLWRAQMVIKNTRTIPTAPANSRPSGTTLKRSQNPPGSDQIPAIEPTLTALQTAADARSVKQHLADLRQAFSRAPTKESVPAIREFLNSKKDAALQQGFHVGGGGFLTEAPTLRTFLLDELERLDPAAAAQYAKTILASIDSPDEWAIALRSLAHGDPSVDGRGLLERKVEELLAYEPWQQNPSVGYLESFDSAVFLGSTNFIPALGELVRKQDNPAVAHAAFLALDRLTIEQPTTTLALLEANPDLMTGREATRANYFARADVRDQVQRQLLEQYLLNPGLSQQELHAFAGVYPNANFMISQNLLTSNPTPDHDSLIARDAESLKVVNEWLADPRFAKLRPQLEQTKVRLEEFQRQAQGK